MSQENVDAARAGFEAFASGDFERLFTWLDPEIEWDVSRRQLEPMVFRGHQGAREFLGSVGSLWSEQRFELLECLDAGDSVVVTVRFVSTGRDGIEVAALAWYSWEMRAGLLLRATMYQTKAEALEAVGLGE
jgi:ketosteroid isomerase-like protein